MGQHLSPVWVGGGLFGAGTWGFGGLFVIQIAWWAACALGRGGLHIHCVNKRGN